MKNNIETKNTPTNKNIIAICLVATVLIIGLWIWKSVQLSNVKKQAATEMQLVKENMKIQFRNAEELHLKSIAKPLVWVIRSEMLKNNISQMNLYANEMVKEKNFQKIVVTNDKGVAILSTNKKEEGKSFISPGKSNYIEINTTIVENVNDNLLIMTSPIMGFNNRLGTLIVTYSLQIPELK
ncbi:MAG: hypothetical protein H7Z76_13865 [Methylotenera sp.]|nr:hypothetical protein [Flavobacterium sp.]